MFYMCAREGKKKKEKKKLDFCRVFVARACRARTCVPQLSHTPSFPSSTAAASDADMRGIFSALLVLPISHVTSRLVRARF